MSQRFIKFIPCEEVELLLKKPFCHALLTLVAIRARRNPDHPDGLQPGECYIGDHDSIGATRQEYRTALKFCVSRKYLTILETCRTRKKSTTGITTRGTKVKLLDSGIWDINLCIDNHQPNHCLTTDQPPTNHEQERIRTKKEGIKKGTIVNEEKIVRPEFRSPSSFQEDLKQLSEAAIAMKWDIDTKDFSIWLKKYGVEKINQHLIEMDKQKYKIKNHARWMQAALDNDYIGQKEIIEKNRQYAEDFKKHHNWRSLTIRKKYCRNEDSQNEYYFYCFTPELFQEHLKNEHKSKENFA